MMRSGPTMRARGGDAPHPRSPRCTPSASMAARQLDVVVDDEERAARRVHARERARLLAAQRGVGDLVAILDRRRRRRAPPDARDEDAVSATSGVTA